MVDATGTYVKFLGVLAQGSVVLLDEEPGDFILSEVAVGRGAAALLGGLDGTDGVCGRGG